MLNLKDKILKLRLWEEPVRALALFSIIFVFSVFSKPTYAGSEGIVEKIRPHLVKVIGSEWTNKILGSDPNAVILPAIPEIAGDSKAQRTMEKDTKKLSVSKDKEQALDYLFIKEIYIGTRNKNPNDNDIAKYFNVLNQGATREGVYRALVLGNEYRGLENMDNPSSASVVDFSMYFFPRFINKSIAEKTLKDFNFFSLKRVLTEESLEIIDEYLYSKKRSELYDWYGVLSGELAEKYPEVFKNNKLRNATSKVIHKNWAAEVPDQFIKSEVIIKLHFVLNYLVKR